MVVRYQDYRFQVVRICRYEAGGEWAERQQDNGCSAVDGLRLAQDCEGTRPFTGVVGTAVMGVRSVEVGG